MTDPDWTDGDEISLFTLITIVLRNLWRIIRWACVGAALIALYVIPRPALYRASASFITQGQTDATRSGLANLAGQLGVALPTANQSLSPDFYAQLLSSREILSRVARDTFVVEESRRRIAFLDLFQIGGATPKIREEEGERKLMRIVSASVVKSTGVVEISAETRWPSVSMAIVTDLLAGINDFNQHMRQEQAGAERRFVESRLAIAGSDLRAAEDRLEEFLKTNRQFISPDLSFQKDRLQRDVTFKQQVFTSLTQSYEEVRIREVRDTPVITVVESPSVPTLPEPRRRVLAIVLGFLLGAFAGILISFVSQMIAFRNKEGDAEAASLVGTMGDVKSEMMGSVRWLRKRIGQ
jgi:uncharacterized protein involved in exopolysaccharide biosynthesis